MCCRHALPTLRRRSRSQRSAIWSRPFWDHGLPQLVPMQAACPRDCAASPGVGRRASRNARSRARTPFDHANAGSRSALSSSRSTICSGSTRALRMSSRSPCDGWRPSRSPFLRRCEGARSRCRSRSTAAFPGFRRLPIEPLSVGAIHRLLWGRLGLALPRPVLVRVHRITGGNPFFALELGRALTDGTIRADSVDVALPESLRAVVAQRLSALPGRVRETLVAVAALGSPSVTVLKPLGGTVVDDIELAQRLRVLELEGDRIRFAHPASRARLLRGDASAQTAPSARTTREPRRRSGGTCTAPRDRGRGPEREGRSRARCGRAACRVTRGRASSRGARRARGCADATDRSRGSQPTPRHGRYAVLNAGDMKKAADLLQEAAGSADPGPLRAEALFHLAGVKGEGEGHQVSIELLERALAEPGSALASARTSSSHLRGRRA